MTETGIGFASFLILSFLRIPIAFSMIIVGFIGFGMKVNFNAASAMLGQAVYETGLSYTLSVVPLFILMGNLIVRAGVSAELFEAAYRFVGHKRGGLAMASVMSCAGFGAVCGSSVATAATFAKVAYPSMRKFDYDDGFAASTLAAGGTLGILIPPSTFMVLYGIMTETSIAKVFIAGIVPGILAALLFCATISVTTRLSPALAPCGKKHSWRERLQSLPTIWPVIALFTLVMGGIYGGLFTTTEGAGIGAAGALVFALYRRALTWPILFDLLAETARTTAVLFLIVIGALVFANFVNYTSMPGDLRDFVMMFELHPIIVVIAICLIYVILGTVMEEISMMLLTIPLFFPLIIDLGFDPVWFGILVIIAIQIGMISPPVGMNIFVVRSVLPHIPILSIFKRVWPLNFALVVLGGFVIAFPSLALWLPSYVK
ncbi:MAG: TRAP transporter large permease [Burkholderiaceae bacterium]|nr:TRAP transporter large permease [Burkholderiaceae bacterium]